MISPMVRWFSIACGCATMAASAADERFPFVIPGDDASPSVTNMAGLSPRAAGADGFVQIKDSHFATAAGRIRFWGMNTCFSANFPEHGDATKVAAHLAKLGVNAVRMHHHDTLPEPRGIWGPYVDDRRTLSAQQLDRQDYFLNELHRHGVYANLNLHVGRELATREGVSRDGLPYATRFDKYLLYFMPDMRRRLKEFSREYLLHENPYRRLRRVDDPGIAMIEITNENSFAKLGPDLVAAMPEPFRGEFKRQWNDWLARRYRTTASLQKGWAQANEPLGAPVATSDGWRHGLGGWRATQSPRFPLRLRFGQPDAQAAPTALTLEPHGAASELSAQELQLPNLQLLPGKAYTLSFWIRADRKRSLFFDVSRQGPGDWSAVGLHETLELNETWQHVRRVFRVANNLTGPARICFKFGGSPVSFMLAGLTLRPGSDWIIVPPGQTLEARTIDIPVVSWSEAAQRDVREFMADTEREFLADLVQYLKKDLGVRVPITGSQMSYYTTPEVIAATCDYADIHAYWQHPRFPRKPWDPVDWSIRNTPMEASPDADAVLERASWRLLDRPYTMSEWNIPDPNDYAASVVPFAALIASLQDWDGIFFFQYASGEAWYADDVQRFFSFNGQPAKLAMLAAWAGAFRRGDIAPLTAVLAGAGEKRMSSTLGFGARLGIDPKATKPDEAPTAPGRKLSTPDGRAVWDASDPTRASVVVNTPATRAAWGMVAGQRLDLGGVSLLVGPIDRSYAALVLTTLDGRPIGTAGRALLVAVGSAENTAMGWNETRTSVGKDWGRGPAQVNAVPLEVSLPGEGVHIYSLDGRGQRVLEVPAKSAGTFQLGVEYRTLWYEVEWR